MHAEETAFNCFCLFPISGNAQYGQQQDAYQAQPQQPGYQQQQYPGQQGYPGQQQGYGKQEDTLV